MDVDKKGTNLALFFLKRAILTRKLNKRECALGNLAF